MRAAYERESKEHTLHHNSSYFHNNATSVCYIMENTRRQVLNQKRMKK
jgi:hypothetical protein